MIISMVKFKVLLLAIKCLFHSLIKNSMKSLLIITTKELLDVHKESSIIIILNLNMDIMEDNKVYS